MEQFLLWINSQPLPEADLNQLVTQKLVAAMAIIVMLVFLSRFSGDDVRQEGQRKQL